MIGEEAAGESDVGMEVGIADVNVAAVEGVVEGAVGIQACGGVGVGAVAKAGDAGGDDFAVGLEGDAGEDVAGVGCAAEIDFALTVAGESGVGGAVGVEAGDDVVGSVGILDGCADEDFVVGSDEQGLRAGSAAVGDGDGVGDSRCAAESVVDAAVGVEADEAAAGFGVGEDEDFAVALDGQVAGGDAFTAAGCGADAAGAEGGVESAVGIVAGDDDAEGVVGIGGGDLDGGGDEDFAVGEDEGLGQFGSGIEFGDAAGSEGGVE